MVQLVQFPNKISISHCYKNLETLGNQYVQSNPIEVNGFTWLLLLRRRVDRFQFKLKFYKTTDHDAKCTVEFFGILSIENESNILGDSKTVLGNTIIISGENDHNEIHEMSNTVQEMSDNGFLTRNKMNVEFMIYTFAINMETNNANSVVVVVEGQDLSVDREYLRKISEVWNNQFRDGNVRRTVIRNYTVREVMLTLHCASEQSDISISSRSLPRIMALARKYRMTSFIWRIQSKVKDTEMVHIDKLLLTERLCFEHLREFYIHTLSIPDLERIKRVHGRRISGATMAIIESLLIPH